MEIQNVGEGVLTLVDWKFLFEVKKKYDEIFIETYDYNKLYCLHKYHFQIKGTKYDVGI